MKLAEVTIQELEMLEVSIQAYTAKQLADFHKRTAQRGFFLRLLRFIPFVSTIKDMVIRDQLQDLGTLDRKLKIITEFYMKIHAATGMDADMKPVTYAAMKGIVIVE